MVNKFDRVRTKGLSFFEQFIDLLFTAEALFFMEGVSQCDILGKYTYKSENHGKRCYLSLFFYFYGNK